MKVLVTGGAGFIGSTMVRKLLDADHEVRVLDALTYAAGNSWENLEGLDIEKNEGDICNIEACSSAVRGVETVLHFAAETHVTRSEIDPELFKRVNFNGTVAMLVAVIRNENVGSFIHVSTDEVYGSIREGYYLEEDKEVGDHQASKGYAKSKSSADDFVRSVMDKYRSLKITIVRPTNNFGPRQYPEKALPRWICQLLRGKKIEVWGQGKQVRDWLFVEDCCQGILTLVESGATGVYNIAANNDPEITNLEMAKMLVDILHAGQDYERYIEFVDDPRPSHDFRYGISTEKINRDFGWQPQALLPDALRKTVEWYFDHQDWWQRRIKESEKLYAGKE